MKKKVLNRAILLIILFLFLFLSFEIRAITFKNPFEKDFQNLTFEKLIENIVNFIFWVAMAIVPIVIIIAAYYLLTSGGDPEKVRTAKRIIFWTFIGLIIVLLGKGIISIIWQILGGGPTPTTPTVDPCQKAGVGEHCMPSATCISAGGTCLGTVPGCDVTPLCCCDLP